MLNIPTTELISVQFNVLVFCILFTLCMGMWIGYEIRSIALKYRFVKYEIASKVVNQSDKITTN